MDEAYSDFVRKNFVSALHFNKSKKFLIVVNSLSKNLEFLAGELAISFQIKL